ncbi:MAG: inseCt neurotoxin 1c [Clostridia bacterium]|nr:inseCt neurotoxin 1c [Clostridia bacterium]
MRETMFFILGMMMGGVLGTFIMCALSLGARHERVEAENDEARR